MSLDNGAPERAVDADLGEEAAMGEAGNETREQIESVPPESSRPAQEQDPTRKGKPAGPFFVVPFDEIPNEEWDNVVEQSPEGWLYQTSAWIQYAGYTGSQSVSFGLRGQDRKLIGLFPLYRQDMGKFKAGRIRRLYTGLSGPVIAGGLPAKLRESVWKQLFLEADAMAQSEKIDLLQVRLTNMAPAYQPGQRTDVNPLFKSGLVGPLSLNPLNISQPFSRVICLSKSDEQILREMDGDCRAAIRQASRFGITVEVAEKREDLNDFVALHSSTWNRTGSDAHELDYFTAMWDHFHGIGAMKVLFALHQEKRIAAVIIHVFKDAAFYWAGCSEFASLKLRPNNILLWEAMREARANGAKWFEVGYFYAAPGPSRKEYNIGKYKSQFGSDQLIPFEGQKIYHPVRVLGLELLRQIKPGLKQLLKRGE